MNKYIHERVIKNVNEVSMIMSHKPHQSSLLMRMMLITIDDDHDGLDDDVFLAGWGSFDAVILLSLKDKKSKR